MTRRTCLLLALMLAASATPVLGQTYRNRINERFRTVATGPMQAVVVDAPDLRDAAGVRQAAYTRVAEVRRQREVGLRRGMAALRALFPDRRELNLGYGDIVVLRERGLLALSATRAPGRGGHEIAYSVPTSGPGSWTLAQQSELQALVGVLYPALKQVYGPPSWSGTVTLLNGDNMSPIIGDPDALSGGVYNVSTNEIVFAQYLSPQTRVLNLTQMLALSFRGAATISYDAWERGMARAATQMTVAAVLGPLESLYGSGAIDLSDPLWHALDRYDLLNQPALGNDRFYPPSRAGAPANTAAFPNMLAPRLMMAGSAWLKVATTAPSFLQSFNAAYYAALAADPTVRNSVPRLRQIAAQALISSGVAHIEGLPFEQWFERQFALDTSVSPGAKLYALVSPIRPDTENDDDFAVGVVLYYFRTQFDGSGAGDEVNLRGTSYPIFWDHTSRNRLWLGAQYERVDIIDGVGAVAPTVFNVIGGDPNEQGRMRIVMEFPVNAEVARFAVSPRSMGKRPSPNNWWGVIAGADTGQLRIDTDTGVSAVTDVRQGAFGAAIDAAAFRRPNRATLTFTPTVGPATVRQIVVGRGELVLLMNAVDPVSTRTVDLPAGPAMISFPIQPLRAKAAEALLNPADGTPLFNDMNLLMAQWRQSQPGEDKYLRYPTMEPLQTGKGYWSNLPAGTRAMIVGSVHTQDAVVSRALLHGWNQIGNPFEASIPIENLQFQYLADNIPVTLQEAIAREWVAAQDIPGGGQTAVWAYAPESGYVAASQLDPWEGYWIRVLVSEGLTITYANPSRAARVAPATRAARSAARGWSVAFTVRGPGGTGSTAVLGQGEGATPGPDARFDALRPPEFVRSAPVLAFHRGDWGDASGAYFSDMRAAGSREPWELTVSTPTLNATYTLAWSGGGSLPRSTRLVLVDTATGSRRYLLGGSSLTFTTSTETLRRFRVEVEDRGRHALRVLAGPARMSRSGAGVARLTVTLTAGALLDAVVRTADGRSVRRIQMGRATPAGETELLWDGRDDRAISVPAGMYLIELRARTPEGEQARTVAPLVVTR
ncbi:MAG TPA: FlgD immunoglobulin-like domain containing protein [Chthonomonadales bacterium]|nr:FlgD immunoglobulin-like domain containing protein [Chthonomonadales bacterium]